MKTLTFVCFVLCCGISSPAHAQQQAEIDPVRVSPDRYRVLLDNPEVRVIEYVLRPGERDLWHTTPPKVSYVASGGSLRITQADGTSFVTDEKQGTARWTNTLGRHYAQNVGATPVRIILVEVKSAPRSPAFTSSPIAPASPVAPAAPVALSALSASLDCVARRAADSRNGTTMFDAAKLESGIPGAALPVREPHRFTVSIVVDTVGHADAATLEVPADIDPATVEVLRTVLPAWRFSPARLGGCPVKQVVRLTFSR
jgi:hypothetical protein